MPNNFTLRIGDGLREYFILCVKSAAAVCGKDPALYGYISDVMREISAINGESETGLLDIFYHLISFEPFKTIMSADISDIAVNTRAARNLAEISRMIPRFNYLHDAHKISEKNKLTLPEEFFNIYIKSLYEDGVGEYEDYAEYAPRGCVSFMTVHQSKGLEFPAVFVGSLSGAPRRDGDVPLFAAGERFFQRKRFEPPDDIKFFDFRRLYYTAFSRAKNLLVLVCDKKISKHFLPFAEKLCDVSNFSSAGKFDEIRAVNYKRVYSYTSHISLYDGCPRQYKFYKEFALSQGKMLHTSIGSLIHATLEDINKAAINGKSSEISEEIIREWFDLNCAEIAGATGYLLDEKQREDALEQVLRYYENNKNELSRVRNSEVEINLILPEFILQGVIDLVLYDGEGVMIVDYKTGPKPDFIANPRSVEHYRRQLEIYAFLFERQTGVSVSKMRLYYTREKDPLIEFPYSKENIERTMNEIYCTINSIESGDFSRGVQNLYACEFCDLKYFCKKEEIK